MCFLFKFCEFWCCWLISKCKSKPLYTFFYLHQSIIIFISFPRRYTQNIYFKRAYFDPIWPGSLGPFSFHHAVQNWRIWVLCLPRYSWGNRCTAAVNNVVVLKLILICHSLLRNSRTLGCNKVIFGRYINQAVNERWKSKL